MSFEKEKSSHPINAFGKPAAAGPGKEKFKPKGSENLGGQASQQPTQSGEKHSKPGNEDMSVDAGHHTWKHEHSIGHTPNTPGAGA